MRDENFVVIQGWMRNIGVESLKELFAFAIVYGFSQDGESAFKGSINYIAECMMCDKSTAIRIMKKLEEKGLVDKQQEEINGVKFNRYRVLEGVVAKYHYQWQNATGGSGKMQHNNNIYKSSSINNNNNININNNIGEIEENHENNLKLLECWLGDDISIRQMQFYELGLIKKVEEFDDVFKQKIREYYERCRLDCKSDLERRGRHEVASHFNYWLTRNNNNNKKQNQNEGGSIEQSMQQLMEGLEGERDG